MLAKFTRWLEAGLPVELPWVTLLKARQCHQSVGVIGVPAQLSFLFLAWTPAWAQG